MKEIPSITNCPPNTVHRNNNIWISKNSDRFSVIELWHEKPLVKKIKLKNSKGKKVFGFYYSVGDTVELTGFWINEALCKLLFGVAPKEGQLIGPIAMTAEFVNWIDKKKGIVGVEL